MNTYSQNSQNNLYQLEVQKYVAMMKDCGITSIAAMNRYLSKNNMWGRFVSIKRINTYTTGKSLMGISVNAYREIVSLYKTDDVITSRLVTQNKVKPVASEYKDAK